MDFCAPKRPVENRLFSCYTEDSIAYGYRKSIKYTTTRHEL